MKKYKIILLTLVFILLYFSTSTATDTKVSAIVDKTDLKLEDEFQTSIMIQGSKCAAYNLEIYFDDTKIQYVKQDGNENISINGNKLSIVWYDKKGGLEAIEGVIANLKWKTIGEGICNFILDGEFYAPDGNEIEAVFQNFTVSIGDNSNNIRISDIQNNIQAQEKDDNNCYLKSLRLNIEGISPSFDKFQENYSILINNQIKDIEIIATPENENAQVQISGNKNLKEGNNEILIKVISTNKIHEKTYKISVIKTSNLEQSNADLEVLALENVLLTPEFSPNNINYEAEISNEINNIKILAIPQNVNASVDIKGNQELKEGINKIVVTVTSENYLLKKVYTVNLYKRNIEEENTYKEELQTNQNHLNEIYQNHPELLLATNEDKDFEQNIRQEELTEQKNNSKNQLWNILWNSVVLIIAEKM